MIAARAVNQVASVRPRLRGRFDPAPIDAGLDAPRSTPTPRMRLVRPEIEREGGVDWGRHSPTRTARYERKDTLSTDDYRETGWQARDAELSRVTGDGVIESRETPLASTRRRPPGHEPTPPKLSFVQAEGSTSVFSPSGDPTASSSNRILRPEHPPARLLARGEPPVSDDSPRERTGLKHAVEEPSENRKHAATEQSPGSDENTREEHRSRQSSKAGGITTESRPLHHADQDPESRNKTFENSAAPRAPDLRSAATLQAVQPVRVQPRTLPVSESSARFSKERSEEGVGPTIHVTIGRVEVRAVQPSPTPAKTRTNPQAMKLDDYLRGRGQGGAR
jgi:hypothetical protein